MSRETRSNTMGKYFQMFDSEQEKRDIEEAKERVKNMEDFRIRYDPPPPFTKTDIGHKTNYAAFAALISHENEQVRRIANWFLAIYVNNEDEDNLPREVTWAKQGAFLDGIFQMLPLLPPEIRGIFVKDQTTPGDNQSNP